MRWRKSLIGAAAAVALAVGGVIPAANASPPGASTVDTGAAMDPAACESLLSVDLGENVTVESAVQDAGDASTPASCRVQVATTHPPAGDKVTIWVYLPSTGWNGRFLGVGGGGFSGGTAQSLVGPMSQGFAAGATDAGNPARTAAAIGMNPDGTINWVGQENFGNRGIHEMTVNGKALVEAYYGQTQDYAYFSGCSTGGRQGAMEAQKYPDDYDGITAGAPVFNYPKLQIAQLWSQVVMREEDNVLSQCKLDTVLAAVTAACDEVGDGVVDGVIGDPLACDFDFSTLVGTVTPCDETITAEDAAVLEAIREGPRGAGAEFLWYGLVPGAPYLLTASTVDENGQLVGAPFGNPVQVIAYWLEQNPDWDWRTETYESFEAHMAEAVSLYDDVHGASDPDLNPFIDAGGKLLFWHGYADFGVYTQGTIDYYERMQDIVGEQRAADSVRLFLAPGVGHCSGGLGAQPTQQLDLLIRWVEQGEVPQTLPGVRTVNGQVVATRPICAYPEVARYTGTGDANDGANYTCVEATQLTPENDPAAGAPVNVSLPVVSGSPDVGSTLTVAPGEWQGDDLTVTQQWLRNGVAIPGATGTTYTPRSADQGAALSVAVTATNASGSATATSNEVVVRYRSAVLVTTSPFLLATSTRPVTVNVNVFPQSATGDVTVAVAGKTLTAVVTDGRASVDAGRLPRGIHPITVTFAGSDTVSPAVGRGAVIVLR